MRHIIYILVSCALVILPACSSMRVVDDAARSVVGTVVGGVRVGKLLDDLNRSSSRNRIASMKLIDEGMKVVPYIIPRIDLPSKKLRSKNGALKAARSLRVLRQIDPDKALEISGGILTGKDITPSTKYSAALINEALDCVYEGFPLKKARDVFYSFIKKDSDRYLKKVREVQHWGPAYYRYRLEADVFRGFSLMVSSEDNRIKNLLVSFLREISVESLDRTYFYRLAENGYSITQQTTSSPMNDMKSLFSRN